MSFIEPIEQNVFATNSKGVYELTLIEKVSRSIQRFKADAIKFQKITEGKNRQEIENLFWKSLFNNSPLYGADVSGSLFDKNIPWALGELQSILNQGLTDQHIPGVSNPYVYVGQWKSMFGWHTEDHDLYSINYLH